MISSVKWEKAVLSFQALAWHCFYYLGSCFYLSSGLMAILCQKQNQRSEHLPPGLGLVTPLLVFL